jgi:hypothetical protein
MGFDMNAIWPAESIVLVVTPSLDQHGKKAYSSRGQLFDGAVDDHQIVKRSVTPFCDAARALLDDGIEPDTVFVMRQEGSPYDALRSTVGVAAGLTVSDDGGGKPVLRRWSPYNGEKTIPVTPPMRETDSAAGGVLPDLENAPSDGRENDLEQAHRPAA